MTVRELVELLQKLPQDLAVVYDFHSDVREMDAEDVYIVHAESKKIVLRDGMYKSTMFWTKKNIDDPNNEPVTVVNFPGN